MNLKSITGFLILAATAGQAAADCFRTEWDVDLISGEKPTSYSIPDYVPPTSTPPPISSPPPTTGTPTSPDSESPGFSDTTDYDGFAVSGELFLAPVSCDAGPLKEAAFLSRVSSIGGAYTSIETDDDLEIDAWDLFGRIIINRWVFEGDVQRVDEESDFFDFQVDTLRLAVGRYLADATQVLVGYETGDYEDFVETERLTVDIKHVASLENGQSYTVQALLGYLTADTEFGEDDDGFDIQLLGDWYFNNQFSVGTELDFADRDSTGSLFSWSVNATYFFTDRISLALAYEEFDEDDLLAITGDQFTVEFTYRR